MVQSSRQRKTKGTAIQKSKPITNPRIAPHRKSTPVAHVARNLAKLQAQPSAENLSQVQDDIQQQGLDTLFRALTQTPTAKRLAKSKSRQATQNALRDATTPPVPAQLPGVEKGLFGPSGVDLGRVRQTWQNAIGSQIAQPLRLYKPTTLAELQSILQQAAILQCKVKAAGSGHSFTDVAIGPDFLVDTHGLCRTLALECDVLKAGVATGALFETEAGIVVSDLNEALWNAGRGLINMGGYDAQTVMGVVSTSTHGSGLSIGPLSSFVLSMTMVVTGGRVLRIEPQDGITDPARWAAKHPDIELVQDDNTFYACQVGIGCIGIVYSVVMQVMDRYWLKEERTISTWHQVRQDLQAGKVLADNRHYEVLVNPYQTNGDHICLVTRRNPVSEPDIPADQLPQRDFLIELFARFPGSGALLLDLVNTFPDLVPTIINMALHSLARDYIDRSYRVFNIGAANDVPAYGSEIGFPMNTYLDAVERILQIAANGQSIGKAYLTSPFSLRFVKASQAFMSMMHGADTCMIEFPMLDNTIGGKELLRRIEVEMYGFGGRPHWGLLNFLFGGGGLIESMYPEFGTWLSVRRRLDPDGTFDNSFTDRCGISKPVFVRN